MRRSLLILVAAVAAIAGCTNSGSQTAPIVTGGMNPTATPIPAKNSTPSPAPVGSTPTPVPVVTPTPVTVAGCAAIAGARSATIPAGGSGSVTVTAGSGMLTESVAGQIPTASTLCLGYVPQSMLPAPLARFRADRRRPDFTAGAGNVYVAAFSTSFTGGTPSSGVALAGAGVVPATYAAGTQLNIAINQNGTYVDVGTAVVTASNGFTSSPPTVALPGITQTGVYLVYVPAPGTNTSQIDLGFALVADDGSGQLADGLQFVQLEDTSNNAIPTPTTTFFPASGGDLDGQSLTPDASQGAAVDGGNTVLFFSGIPQHTFKVSSTTVDITNYGGDGDSIASLPSGDETVVSGNGTQLAVISGVLAGTPVVADTIPNGNAMTSDRDGLVISNDGKVLLSRGATGLDVFKITPVAAHAGSTGAGTTSYAFGLTTTFSINGATNPIAEPAFEDGRDGMAISPVDSSRAVVVGFNYSTATPEVQLLTGLTSGAPTVQSVRVAIPQVRRRLGSIVRHPEPSAHRAPFAVTPASGSTLYAVTISQDGTTAYVSTDAGILTFGGVNTGTLVQEGSAYSPVLPLPGSAVGCQLQSAASIGTLPDGKFLAAIVSCGLPPGATDSTQGSGVIVTIPILAGGALGAPVGQLNNVVTPFNDQIIFH